MMQNTAFSRHLLIERLANIFALTGGFIMLMLAIVTVASIIGRSLVGQSIVGDYEITEMGLGMAIFLFLPKCYQQQGHVVVDLFTAHCKPSTLRALGILSDTLFTAVCFTFAYRMTLSGLEAKEYLEQSMLLELPTWWTFTVGVICMILCGICGLNRLYTTLRGGNHE